MKTVTLRRTRTGDTGTFGEMMVDEQRFATVELPDRGNQPLVSCIPAGVYQCKRTYSPKHEKTLYEILDVPGRDGVRFDIANWAGDKSKGYRSQVLGCVAVGRTAQMVNGQEGVTDSANSIDLFNTLLGGEDFEIVITDEYLEAGATNGSQTTV